MAIFYSKLGYKLPEGKNIKRIRYGWSVDESVAEKQRTCTWFQLRHRIRHSDKIREDANPGNTTNQRTPHTKVWLANLATVDINVLSQKLYIAITESMVRLGSMKKASQSILANVSSRLGTLKWQKALGKKNKTKHGNLSKLVTPRQTLRIESK